MTYLEQLKTYFSRPGSVDRTIDSMARSFFEEDWKQYIKCIVPSIEQHAYNKINELPDKYKPRLYEIAVMHIRDSLKLKCYYVCVPDDYIWRRLNPITKNEKQLVLLKENDTGLIYKAVNKTDKPEKQYYVKGKRKVEDNTYEFNETYKDFKSAVMCAQRLFGCHECDIKVTDNENNEYDYLNLFASKSWK